MRLIMIIERRIGSQIVRVNCEQTYARAANDVLSEFEKLNRSGTPIRSGTQIRFGWTLLRLADNGNGLLITEPDFVNWPQEGWSLTIDTSFEVLTAQVRLLQRLNVDGEDTYFDQFVIAVPSVLSLSKIFLRRAGSFSAEDSGWLLASVDDPEALAGEAELERIATANFVRLRPALLKVLTLPTGFVVVFAGDSIEQIFDAGGNQRISEA